MTDNELGRAVWIYGTSGTICYSASNLLCAFPDHLRNPMTPGSLLICGKTDLGKVAGRESRVTICCKSEKRVKDKIVSLELTVVLR